MKLLDEKTEIAGAVAVTVAAIFATVEAAGGVPVLGDQWLVGLLIVGLLLWLGPKTWEKLGEIDFGPFGWK